jgi:hypothetical protein
MSRLVASPTPCQGAQVLALSIMMLLMMIVRPRGVHVTGGSDGLEHQLQLRRIEEPPPIAAGVADGTSVNLKSRALYVGSVPLNLDEDSLRQYFGR